MRVVIVSRHKGTVELIKDKIPDAEVIEHLNSIDDIEPNSLVIGNLPIDIIGKLLQKGCRFILVTLNIPKELRGKDLPKEEVKKFAKFLEVKELKLKEFKFDELPC